MAWRYIVVEAATGAAIGEPLARGRQLELGVSAMATAQFRVRSGTALWSSIVAGSTMLKVYDSASVLRFYGEIVADELTASGQGAAVAFTCSDLSWRLSKRLTGKDLTGVGTVFTAVDSGQIIFDTLASANGAQATGITQGNKDSFLPRTTTLLWKNVLQLVSELGAIDGSYEWALRYVDGSPPLVYLDLLTLLGSDKSASVFFEYGSGKNNCQEYRRVRSMETSATRVYALGAGGTLVAEVFDPNAESTRRMEEHLSYGDIASLAALDALAASHVLYRARPRKVVTFRPFAKLSPRYGVDWVVGDYVTARAKIGDLWDTNGVARIWAASITIDEAGNEIAVPRMEPN